jgi:hypothetical protein
LVSIVLISQLDTVLCKGFSIGDLQDAKVYEREIDQWLLLSANVTAKFGALMWACRMVFSTQDRRYAIFKA